MFCHGKACANARVGAWKILLFILDQFVGVARVLLAVAVARNDQIIGERAHQPMQMLDKRLVAPGNQPFVSSAHAPTLAAGEQQDRAGREGIGRGHDQLGWRGKKQVL